MKQVKKESTMLKWMLKPLKDSVVTPTEDN